MPISNLTEAKEALGPKKLAAIAGLFSAREGLPPRIHAARYRVDHEEWIDDLEALVQEQFFFKRDPTGQFYVMRAYALPLIDSDDAKSLFDLALRMYTHFKPLYREHLSTAFPVSKLMERLESEDVGRAHEALYYICDIDGISCHVSNDFPSDNATLYVSEIAFQKTDLCAVIGDAYQRRIVEARYRSGVDPAYFSAIRSHARSSLYGLSEDSLDFKFIADERLRDLLCHDWDEALRTFGVEAWKSCVLLCGGIIEGALIYALRGSEKLANEKYSAIKKRNAPPFENWDLVDLIDVARALGLLRADLGYLSHAIRGFRNLVHPGKQIREDIVVSREEALVARSAVKLCVRDLSAKGSRSESGTG